MNHLTFPLHAFLLLNFTHSLIAYCPVENHPFKKAVELYRDGIPRSPHGGRASSDTISHTDLLPERLRRRITYIVLDGNADVKPNSWKRVETTGLAVPSSELMRMFR